MTLQDLDLTACALISEELTTRTDFVNKHSTVLQATSCLFMATENTSEICVGVIKPQKLVPKSPAQHAADLVKPAMHGKMIECIQVDGSVDEGPSHHEVQFHWAERNIVHCSNLKVQQWQLFESR